MDRQKQVQKLATFAKNPNLALFDQQEEIIELLKVISGNPNFPAFPNIPVTDTSKIEQLLQQLLEKENDIEISLELE